MQFDKYGLRHLPMHIASVGNWAAIAGLLCDLRFVSVKCAEGMTYELVSDYNLALELFPEAKEEKQACKIQEERIAKYVEDLIAYAAGQNDSFFPIPSVAPRSKESIEQEARRIVQNPMRLDRVRAFARFVNAESHGLVKFGGMPGFCIQQAYDSAGSGPVANAAERLLKEAECRCLFLKRRPSRPEYESFPARIRTIEAYASAGFNSVTSVWISPDGAKALSGSEDKVLQFWDLRDGRCIHVLKGHAKDIRSVAATPDAQIGVSCSEDKTVGVWDLAKGVCLAMLTGHDSGVEDVDITPDGSKAVSGGREKSIKVWDLHRYKCIRTIEDSGDAGRLRVSADGKRAVAAGLDGKINVWDLETGKLVRVLAGHEDGVDSLAITPDGEKAITGSWDETLRVWDLSSGKCLGVHRGRRYERFSCAAITADGRRAVTGSEGWEVRAWDFENRRCDRIVGSHSGWIYGISMTPDGRRAVSGGGDNAVVVWDLENGRTESLKALSAQIMSVDVAPDGRKSVTASLDETIRVWDAASGECIRTIRGHEDEVHCVKFFSDGRRLVSGGNDNTIRIWDVETGACLQILRGHELIVADVAISPDQKYLVSGSGDKTVRVWNADTGKCLRILKAHRERVHSLAISPDGKTVVSGSDRTFRKRNGRLVPVRRECICVWNIVTGACLNLLEGHAGSVQCIRFAPDGQRFVTASKDSMIGIWEAGVADQWHCVRKLKGHADPVLCVSVTPNGKNVISGSEDRTLRMWDIDSGECLAAHQAQGSISSVSQIDEKGLFAYATYTEDVVFMRIVHRDEK